MLLVVKYLQCFHLEYNIAQKRIIGLHISCIFNLRSFCTTLSAKIYLTDQQKEVYYKITEYTNGLSQSVPLQKPITIEAKALRTRVGE